MDELTDEQLRRIHDALRALAEDCRALLADTTGATATVILDQSAQGRLSRMDAMQRQEMAKAQRRRAQERLARVERALVAFDDPDVDFGECRACEDPIPFKRLLAVPDAAFCVVCTERRERS